VNDACHAHFGTRYLGPINRYFYHWDPEALAQVYKLNIKTPPAPCKERKVVITIHTTCLESRFGKQHHWTSKKKKKKRTGKKVPLQSDVCEKLPCSCSCEHLKPTLELVTTNETVNIVIVIKKTHEVSMALVY
jgi:hypothetical protein